MNKREIKKAEYAAECLKDKQYAEARATVHAVSNALFSVLQMKESVDSFDWHQLVSNCRKAEHLDDHIIKNSFGKSALWRDESEWPKA